VPALGLASLRLMTPSVARILTRAWTFDSCGVTTFWKAGRRLERRNLGRRLWQRGNSGRSDLARRRHGARGGHVLRPSRVGSSCNNTCPQQRSEELHGLHFIPSPGQAG
jgi:hypothetical protein